MNPSMHIPAAGDAAEKRLRRVVWLAFLLASAALWWPVDASASARIKEVASVAGVRSNQLTGYVWWSAWTAAAIRPPPRPSPRRA
jgi:hypothetical protein